MNSQVSTDRSCIVAHFTAGDAATPAPSPSSVKRKRLMRWARRAMVLATTILVAVMLSLLVKNLDWHEVTQALQSFKSVTLLLACLVVIASYVTYGCYDLLGRRYTRHHLPARQVMPVSFVCYAFNLNLGSWVGSIALRYRLYSRLGLKSATITEILSLALITNWLGYMLLAGIVLFMGHVELPPGWGIDNTSLRLIGLLLFFVAMIYLLACRFSTRREWRVRGYSLRLPSARLALLQACFSVINWSLMALVIYLLLPTNVFYPSILSVLLISSIAGVISHIPAGLGVLEAVFITLLHPQLSKGALLAALIGYRALYFLLPLAIATVVYVVLERRAKAMRAGGNLKNLSPATE
jgi:uncharacterized membrane protein YbhN (UPF0104 family)